MSWQVEHTVRPQVVRQTQYKPLLLVRLNISTACASPYVQPPTMNTKTSRGLLLSHTTGQQSGLKDVGGDDEIDDRYA